MCIVWYIMQEASETSDAGSKEANVEGVAEVSSGQSGWFLP